MPVNWKKQWELHCPYYDKGLLRLNLKEGTLLLEPGPGFGDLSHPTTRLALKMLLPLVQGRFVVDVGCGSGILALAAAVSGAKKVFAWDIDPEALQHAQKNAELNGLEIVWEYPRDVPRGTLAVMNMIRSEQASVSLRGIEQWVTSGVLREEKEPYLKECSDRGWLLQDYFEEQNWLAFNFCTSLLSCHKGSSCS